MKIQDILFFVIILFLIWKRSAKASAIAGIIFLILSIPLFAGWVFFTAERFTYYAAGFFLLAIILSLWKMRQN